MKAKLVWKVEKRIETGIWKVCTDAFKTHAEAIAEKWRLIGETGFLYRTAACEVS